MLSEMPIIILCRRKEMWACLWLCLESQDMLGLQSLFSSLKAAKWESAAGVLQKYKPISSLVISLAVFNGSAVIHSDLQSHWTVLETFWFLESFQHSACYFKESKFLLGIFYQNITYSGPGKMLTNCQPATGYSNAAFLKCLQ